MRLPKPPGADKDRLLFVNPHNPSGRERRNLSVKMNEDGGQTWPVARSIEPGTSGYADLAAGPDGSIFCLYERGSAGGGATNPRSLCLARFNLEWLTGGKDPGPSGGGAKDLDTSR
jgi:sialidase-1